MQPEPTSPISRNGRPSAEAEADHRIANNLALLNGVIRHKARDLKRRSGMINTAEAYDILQDLSFRVEAMGRLHMLLAKKSKGNAVSLADLVEEICTHVVAILPPGRAALSIVSACPAEVEACDAIHIGRILAEMLTNAIKYAHPTGIPVHIHVASTERADGSILVEIKDDGVGLPEGFEPATDGGLGFRVMYSTAEHLGGHVEFEQTFSGLSARLIIPGLGAAHEATNVVPFQKV